MKKILVMIVLILNCLPGYASHAMGGELTYRALDNQSYEITYILYRDCSGIPPPATIDINIVPQTGSSTLVIVNPTAASPVTLHTTCPSELTTCNGGFNRGVQKCIYCDTIQLTTGIFTLYHSENARNAALTTIIGTGADNLFVYAVINNTGQQNSSPVFEVNPVISLCIGQSYCIPSFVRDVDGDSLVFEFITPRTGPLPADTVTYYSPYSASQPFTSSPAVTLDASTGELCVTPVSAEVSPVAILVTEYRNGVMLGQVERDMQTQIDVCNNQLPSVSGFNGAPTQTLNLCATMQNCFFITGYDSDVGNVTFVNWENNLPGALTTHTLGNRDTLYVCWMPSDMDTIGTKCFTAMISDDNCPYPSTTYKEFCLNITPSRICNPNNSSPSGIAAGDLFTAAFDQSDKIIFNVLTGKTNQSILLCNTLGIIVGRSTAVEKNVAMDVSGLSKGIYLAMLTDESARVICTRKIVIPK
jgi:hypothetical protein